jgi:hypothetical protein
VFGGFLEVFGVVYIYAWGGSAAGFFHRGGLFGDDAAGFLGFNVGEGVSEALGEFGGLKA